MTSDCARYGGIMCKQLLDCVGGDLTGLLAFQRVLLPPGE